MAARRFCSIKHTSIPTDTGMPAWLVGMATVGMGIGGFLFIGKDEEKNI